MDRQDCKPQITYPCRWGYKLIGRDLAQLNSAVTEVLSGRDYRTAPPRSSEKGGYHCLAVEMTVEDEKARLWFYERLREHPATIMVL